MKVSEKKNLFSVGLIVSVLALTFTIYQGYRSNINAEIARLEVRISDVRKELAEPIVSVDINSAAEMLDDELIAQLGSVPVLITMEDIKGDTAKNITLVVHSSERIRRFKKLSAVDP